ncbi:MAG: helix-turn-helix domain-containing protein [Polyangiaceae bacterium]
MRISSIGRSRLSPAESARMCPLSLLKHPYTHLQPLTGGSASVRAVAREPGTALVWQMEPDRCHAGAEIAQHRPGGIPLLVILPPGQEDDPSAVLMSALQHTRPLGILPYHPNVLPTDLAQVLRRDPADLAADVTDYLRWRGIDIERETVQLIRRIIELSSSLRTLSAVCRSLYVSRRALGRRFSRSGLPVPSHWLQIARILRVSIRLQNTGVTVSSSAFELGYPDGFAFSNQVERLVGVRPSMVRLRLGWEWIFESWLRREAEAGRFCATRSFERTRGTGAALHRSKLR